MFDIHGRGDEQLLDDDALGAGLLADHLVAEHESGGFANLIQIVAELDEAGFAASAGEDLGLDDYAAADFSVGLLGLLGGVDHFGGGHGHAGGLVTHDTGEAGYRAEEIVLMRAGQIVQRGSLEALVRRPEAPFVSEFVKAQRSPLESLAAGEGEA